MTRYARSLKTASLAVILTTCAICGCGNPHNPDIVYKKMTMEEFEKLSPEDQELPEVQENMGDQWRDPNDPKTATNPKRRIRNAPKKS
jgi:hypothetical protein